MEDKRKCHICNGIGFHNGKICVCITGKQAGNDPADIPDEFKDIFGDIFRYTEEESNKRSG